MAVAAADDADEVGGEDLAALGVGAEPHGLDHGQPEAVAALERDVAERDADADVSGSAASRLRRSMRCCTPTAQATAAPRRGRRP